MIRDSQLLKRYWARRGPAMVDTVLLISALVRAHSIHQYPGTFPWLTAKVTALLVYIWLGMIAFHWGKTKRIKISAWVAAQVCFFYIVSVALTRNPSVFW